MSYERHHVSEIIQCKERVDDGWASKVNVRAIRACYHERFAQIDKCGTPIARRLEEARSDRYDQIASVDYGLELVMNECAQTKQGQPRAHGIASRMNYDSLWQFQVHRFCVKETVALTPDIAMEFKVRTAQANWTVIQGRVADLSQRLSRDANPFSKLFLLDRKVQGMANVKNCRKPWGTNSACPEADPNDNLIGSDCDFLTSYLHLRCALVERTLADDGGHCFSNR